MLYNTKDETSSLRLCLPKLVNRFELVDHNDLVLDRNPID